MDNYREDGGRPETVEFRAKKKSWLFSLPAPAAVLLCTVVMAYFIMYMITDPNIVAQVAGVVLGISYVGYVFYYYFMYIISRRHITSRAVLTGDYLESECAAGVKHFYLDEIVFSMSYSSSTNLCIIAATQTDYVVLSCSCAYLFSKGGKEVLTPFYAINEFFMGLNEKHVNYVKNKKYKRKNPYYVPHFLFEIEFYTKRVGKFINKTRERYRFCETVLERKEESMGETAFRTKIVGMGNSALSFLEQKMIIFFNHKAQSDLAEYSVLIDDGEGECDFGPGDTLILGDTRYGITAVGEAANKNLAALGHAVIKFNGKTSAELPGDFHVEDKEIEKITAGLTVVFLKN